MNKNIINENDKGQLHGYWEWYSFGCLRYKSFFHNGIELGYEEEHSLGEIKEKIYHI